MEQDKVYVTGHQHPDTDSIAAAIGYAFFKRANGVKAIPCRLGKLAKETKYLLDRFGFEEPMLLEDARFKLSEIKLDKPVTISPEETLSEAIDLMLANDCQICGVVNEAGELLGIVTHSDAAELAIGDAKNTTKALRDTPVECICKAVNGKIVYNDPQSKVNGKVSIVALTKEKFTDFDFRDHILITGNDPGVHKELVGMCPGVLIVVRTDEVEPETIEAAKENHCSIIISDYDSINSARNVFFAPQVKNIMTPNTKKLEKFYAGELVEEVLRKMMKSRYHSYPVIDDDGKLLGFASRFHVLNAGTKKIILVDHNEFSQSVKGIEKAQVLEVIDHHRINDFSTNHPVAFRNEIIGSSATIVATVFKEKQIPLPKNLAGLLLGAILSDTLKFQSPTTTKRDIDTAKFLAGIAGLDIDQFAMDMFSVSTDIKGKTVNELLNQDIKFFNIEGCKTMISQVMVPSADTARQMAHQINRTLEEFTKKKGLDLCVMAMTSIVENGSIIFEAGDKAPWAVEAFPEKPGETMTLQTGVLSRKKQLVPRLTKVIEKYA